MARYTDKGVFFIRALFMILGCTVFFFAASFPSWAQTQWNVDISGGSDGIRGFHLSVGDYYDVPEREVVVVKGRGIHDEELPVVFFLARRARVSPRAIVDLHLRGLSWMDITLHYGLSPEIFYVPVTLIEEHHHPRGHAYGYYKKHKKHEWKKIVLSDDDIVDQVNLRFLSEHHRYAPEKIIRYRSGGRNFVAIDRDVRHERHGKGSGKDRGVKRENRDHRERKDAKGFQERRIDDVRTKGKGRQDEGKDKRLKDG